MKTGYLGTMKIEIINEETLNGNYGYCHEGWIFE